jgi:peptidyl-prolyl cis-trans isomerase C
MGWKPENDEAFRSFLLSRGQTLPVLRRQFERQMMAEEYVRSVLKEKKNSVGLAEVREYFDQHPDEFQTPERVKWQHIFISFNKFPSPQDAYKHALAIQQHAAAGEDFAALSRTYDHGFAGLRGNGTGLGSERGKIEPKDVEATVWALKPGEVSGLIETPAGYHIVRVAEREYAGVKPFDDKVQKEVRGKLMRQTEDREYKRMVEDLWWKGVARIMELP